MAPTRTVLAQTNFPLYAVQALDSTHFLVAGGGGQAKTGVPNVIEIFELKQTADKVVASSICHHDTGTDAVMNCASSYDGRNYVVACGQEEKCHLYSVKYKVISPKKTLADSKDKDAGVRKRKGDGEEEEKTLNGTKQLTFEVQPLCSVKTDFHKDGGFQKVVRINASHKIVATGGADGFLRVWKFPDLKKSYEVKAHKDDIDDLDISPSGDRIVTVSRDHTGVAWSAKEGKKLSDLVWNSKEASQYRYRCCRFGAVENKKDKLNLYTISIPAKRSSNPAPCHILLWDTETMKVRRSANAGTEVLSALSVSDDGVYLGVGTISGSVSVYISFSLQRLYHLKEAHSIFVTGVEFLPASEATRAIVGNQDFSLLSVSADDTVHLHQMPERGSIGAIWVILGCFVIIFLIFWLMAELGV